MLDEAADEAADFEPAKPDAELEGPATATPK